MNLIYTKHIALASIHRIKARIQPFQRKTLDDLYHIAFSFLLSLPGGVQETVSFLIQPFWDTFSSYIKITGYSMNSVSIFT